MTANALEMIQFCQSVGYPAKGLTGTEDNWEIAHWWENNKWQVRDRLVNRLNFLKFWQILDFRYSYINSLGKPEYVAGY